MKRKMSSMPPGEVAGLFRSTVDGTIVRFIGWGNHYDYTHFCGEVVEPHGDYPDDIPIGHIKHAWNPDVFEALRPVGERFGKLTVTPVEPEPAEGVSDG